MKLKDSFYQELEGQEPRNIGHETIRGFVEDVVLLRKGKTRSDNPHLEELKTDFSEKFLRVFDRTVSSKLHPAKRAAWNTHDGVMLESPRSLSNASLLGQHLNRMLHRLGVDDESEREKIRAQFLSIVKLKQDPKYIQLLAEIPEEENWSANDFRKGGLYEITKELPGNSSERIQMALRLLRPFFDISRNKFQAVLSNCESVSSAYSEYELLYYAAYFFLKKPKVKSLWTYTDVRRMKTRTSNVQNPLLTTSPNLPIGQSISKNVFLKKENWGAQEWIEWFEEKGFLGKEIFGKKLSEKMIHKSFEYYDKGGHKKTTETKEKRTERGTASQLKNLLQEVMTGTRKNFRIADIDALSNSKTTTLYVTQIQNKPREEVITFLKDVLKRNKMWSMDFDGMFEEGTFLYGQRETMKEAMDKMYESLRKESLLRFVEKYSSVDNGQFFSAYAFRTEKIEASDFWIDKLGALPRAEFRDRILFWFKEFNLTWEKKYERMFLFYKPRKKEKEQFILSEDAPCTSIRHSQKLISLENESQKERKQEQEYIELRKLGITLSDDVSDFLLEEPIHIQGYAFIPDFKRLLIEMNRKRPDIWENYKKALLDVLKWGRNDYWDEEMEKRAKILFKKMNLSYMK